MVALNLFVFCSILCVCVANMQRLTSKHINIGTEDADKLQYGHHSSATARNKQEGLKQNLSMNPMQRKVDGNFGGAMKGRILKRRRKKPTRKRKAGWRLLLHAYMTTLFDPTYRGKLPLALYNATSNGCVIACLVCTSDASSC